MSTFLTLDQYLEMTLLVLKKQDKKRWNIGNSILSFETSL